MKKRILGSIAILAFAASISLNIVTDRNNGNIDLNVANVEALASDKGTSPIKKDNDCKMNDRYTNCNLYNDREGCYCGML